MAQVQADTIMTQTYRKYKTHNSCCNNLHVYELMYKYMNIFKVSSWPILCHMLQDNNFLYLLTYWWINPINAEWNPICPFVALFAAHLILYISRQRVKGHSSPSAQRLNMFVTMHLTFQAIWFFRFLFKLSGNLQQTIIICYTVFKHFAVLVIHSW